MFACGGCVHVFAVAAFIDQLTKTSRSSSQCVACDRLTHIQLSPNFLLDKYDNDM